MLGEPRQLVNNFIPVLSRTLFRRQSTCDPLQFTQELPASKVSCSYSGLPQNSSNGSPRASPPPLLRPDSCGVESANPIVLEFKPGFGFPTDPVHESQSIIWEGRQSDNVQTCRLCMRFGRRFLPLAFLAQLMPLRDDDVPIFHPSLAWFSTEMNTFPGLPIYIRPRRTPQEARFLFLPHYIEAMSSPGVLESHTTTPCFS